MEGKAPLHVISTAREKSLPALIKVEIGWQQVEYVMVFEATLLPATFQVLMSLRRFLTFVRNDINSLVKFSCLMVQIQMIE